MQNAETLMPILFKVLLAFVCINMAVNFALLLTRKKRIYKLLAAYWPCVLLVFIFQSSYQVGNLAITLAFSATLLPLTVFSMIGFEVLGRKFPIRNYLLYYSTFYPVTLYLNSIGADFVTLAMPFSIAAATPVMHTFYYIWFADRKRSTKLQKILGVTYFAIAIHCINFALFRMEPGAQFWGWATTYVLYDILAILLPSIALEEANLSEKARLQATVDERTRELNESLKVNEGLLKVVLHDISSPLMTMRFYTSYFKNGQDNEEIIEKIRKSQSAMERIILDTKDRYGKNHNKDKIHLQPVGIEECFNEVQFIFGPKLEKKNISLIFNNQLSPNTKVLADQTTLTHSVLSNLVSNGLKFSYPNSVIQVTAKEENENIVLEVKDQGPGIPEKVLMNIMNDKDNDSSEGTDGETGTGFGLSIVKSFINSYGGQIEFDSKTLLAHPDAHGTNIKITLDRA